MCIYVCIYDDEEIHLTNADHITVNHFDGEIVVVKLSLSTRDANDTGTTMITHTELMRVAATLVSGCSDWLTD